MKARLSIVRLVECMPLIQILFTPSLGNPLDRAHHLRKDQAALDALQRSDTSRFLVFHQLKVATNAAGSLAWIPPKRPTF